MKHKFIFILLISNVFIALFTWFLVNKFYQNINTSGEVREVGNYTFISPLLECVNNIQFYNPWSIRENLSHFIESSIENNLVSEVSYYFQSLKTGNNYSYNDEILFTPASLLKLPLAMSLLSYYSPEDMNNISIEWSHFSSAQRNIWSDVPQYTGTQSLKTLMENMLIESDNVAANSLFDYLWQEKVKEIYLDLGVITDESTNIFSHGINTKRYASFLRILYNASYLSPNLSEYILWLLSESSYRDGLRAQIPGYIKIAHKFWERSVTNSNIKQLHDCGIIYYPENPYILCVMTRWESFTDMGSVISEISQKVFNDIAQYKN